MGVEELLRLGRNSCYPDEVREVLRKLVYSAPRIECVEILPSDGRYVIALTFQPGARDWDLIRSLAGCPHGENGALVYPRRPDDE